MILLDVNVLIYAWQPTAPGHEQWRSWLEGIRGAPFGVPDECALGFLRIVTNRKVFAEPASPSEAFEFIRALRGSPGWREVSRSPGCWVTFEGLAGRTAARAGAFQDVWLAALAMHNGGRLATADHDFAAWPEIQVVRP